MAFGWNYYDSVAGNYWDLLWTITSSQSQTYKFQSNMSCCWAFAMFSFASSNSSVVFEGSYSSLSLSFPQYLNEKQNLWKSQSNFSGCDRSIGKIKRSLCNNFSDANLNCTSLPQNYEKWTGSVKDSCHLYHSEDTLWWKGTQLHLCHSWTFFCSFYSFKQYVKRTNW